MRALLNACGYMPEMDSILHYRPTPLLTIENQPILFYVIEFLVQRKIVKLDLILNHLPHLIENALEDGKRWGISITYHLIKSANTPFSTLRFLSKNWKDELILLGKGDALPFFLSKDLTNSPTVLFTYPDGVWSGWGIFSQETLCQIPQFKSESEILHSIPFQHQTINVRRYLSTCSFYDWKRSNSRALRMRSFSDQFALNAKKIKEGVFISRGTSIHPSVNLIPPVFIGEHCQIKEKAVLGPYTILESNILIDRESCVERSLICSSSYVGEGLEVINCIVDRNLLVNLSHDVALKLHDDFVLSGLPKLSLRKIIFYWIERIIAFLLIIILSPLFLGLYLTHRLVKTEMIKIPAQFDLKEWKTFQWLTFSPLTEKQDKKLSNFFTFLPVLFNIMQGNVHFVGMTPLKITEVEQLPIDWRKLHLRSKTGLITLLDIEYEQTPSFDERYAAEAFYAIHSGVRNDVRILWQWLKMKIKQLIQSIQKKTLNAL